MDLKKRFLPNVFFFWKECMASMQFVTLKSKMSGDMGIGKAPTYKKIYCSEQTLRQLNINSISRIQYQWRACPKVGQCGKKEAGVSTRGPLEILGGRGLPDIGSIPDLSTSLILSSHVLLSLFSNNAKIYRGFILNCEM